MKRWRQNSSLLIVLLVAFIDYMGLGLIYPLFSSMLFDAELPLLPAHTSHEVRGIWLGLLLGLMPAAQFFSAPIWGALSDGKGRKKPLLMSLTLILVGYIVALFGVLLCSLYTLLASRLVLGFAAGNISIVQATIADLSDEERKTKNYGLLSMALGVGFTLGPFFSGVLASYSYMMPFLFAVSLVALNLGLAILFFFETHHNLFHRKISLTMGLSQLKKAFHFRGIRTILLCAFLHVFAWSFFFEFIPVYLIDRYAFTPSKLGYFYAIAGGVYAIGTGWMIRPFVSRFKPETLFFFSNLMTGALILSILILPSAAWIWFWIGLIDLSVAFIWPTATTMVSNSASSQVQGEALGVFNSITAVSLVLSPLFSASIIGAYPSLSMWVGGSVMIIAALITLGSFRKRLFQLP